MAQCVKCLLCKSEGLHWIRSRFPEVSNTHIIWVQHGWETCLTADSLSLRCGNQGVGYSFINMAARTWTVDVLVPMGKAVHRTTGNLGIRAQQSTVHYQMISPEDTLLSNI